MSLISTESSLVTALKPPSLVFPSLHSNSHTNASKYSSADAPNLTSNNNNNEDHSANSKNLQSCIHYASRLIKLRSELRSPSYMNRSNSISESGGDTIGQLFYKSNCTTFGNGRNGRNSSFYELSSTHKSSIHDHKGSSSNSSYSPSLLSDIGRAQSLPNATQQWNLHGYDKEDESEIFWHHHNKMIAANTALHKAAEADKEDEQDEEASQLTYLSDLVRVSLRRRQTYFHETSDHLALPPRHHFDHAPKEPSPRSISLRDMINEAIDGAIQSTGANDNTTADKPTMLRNSQSFTLASQLLFYASQNSNSQQQQQQQQKADQEKGQEQQQQPHQEQEKDTLFLDTTNVKNSLAVTNDEFKEVLPADSHHGAFDEKVEIPSQATTRATSSSAGSTLSQCNKQDTTMTSTIPMPQPSKSRDNKSLFSFISSDSELDAEDDDDTKTSLSIHSFNKRIIQKRRLQKRPQAFLVSISPSSAAAASVARSRRSKTKQAMRAHHHFNSLLH
ncbi:Pre-mRNA-splicing factor cwf19 [Mucor velutinosus]|uniref:Pre-mRNA-splicing factor cwf19 n=1 Tax=Mucor velutinosus TaxID=708070 RepID=A0AAN7DHF5_9FUNG|nr:Pre-mRNA-splicing factor cwf19 [Mucor velutinosus]